MNQNARLSRHLVALLFLVVGGLATLAALNEAGIRSFMKKFQQGDAGSSDPYGELISWVTNRAPSTLYGSTSWVSGSVATNRSVSKAITVTGALPGNYALVSVDSLTNQADCLLNARAGTDTIEATFFNNSGAAIDFGTGTVRVIVFQQ